MMLLRIQIPLTRNFYVQAEVNFKDARARVRMHM